MLSDNVVIDEVAVDVLLLLIVNAVAKSVIFVILSAVLPVIFNVEIPEAAVVARPDVFKLLMVLTTAVDVAAVVAVADVAPLETMLTVLSGIGVDVASPIIKVPNVTGVVEIVAVIAPFATELPKVNVPIDVVAPVPDVK